MNIIVEISDEFLEEIGKSMSKFSYASRAEWVREACRRHLRYLNGVEVDPAPEPQHPQKPDEELKSTIKKLYVDEGLSFRVIGARMRMSPSTVKNRLIEYGIPLRGPTKRYKENF